MATAVRTSHLSSQALQGVCARAISRLGGAVRNVIAGGMTLAGALRRPAAPQPGLDHTVVRKADARPAPGPSPRARRPRGAPLPAPSRRTRLGWVARLLGRCRRTTPVSTARANPVPVSLASFLDDRDASFTPETWPGLSPEFCAILNTPAEDLDPEILRVLLDTFVETVVRFLPPELGMTDAAELLSALRGRLAAGFEDAGLDAPPAAVPAVSGDALPDTLVVSPAPLVDALSRARAEALPDSPIVPAGPASAAQAADRPREAAVIVAECATRPGTASLSGSVLSGRRQVFNRDYLLQYRIITAIRTCMRLFRCCCAFFRFTLLQRPPLRQWCYAARASPA